MKEGDIYAPIDNLNLKKIKNNTTNKNKTKFNNSHKDSPVQLNAGQSLMVGFQLEPERN